MLESEEGAWPFHNFVRNMTLDDICKKIDYEKTCDIGLYTRQYEVTQTLDDIYLDDLIEIENYCNDTIFKQYN